MNIIILLTILLSSTTSWSGYAAEQQTQQATCLTIASSWQSIETLQKQGLYRFAIEKGPVTWQVARSAPYSEYLAQAKAIIESRNPRAQLPCPITTPVSTKLGLGQNELKVADLIAPFELRQFRNDRAVLLLHGLTDSPFTFHYLADSLYQQGFSVRTLLLPGHATAPDDLRRVNYKDWQAIVDYAIAKTAKDFSNFSIVGYSTGAALAITQVAKNPPESLRALALISPASEPHNKNGWLAKWIAKVPWLNWIDADADLDFAKYESFPWQAAALADQAMSQIKSVNLPKTLPLFSALSEVDTTIDSQASLAMLTRFATLANNPDDHTLLYYGNIKSARVQLPPAYPITTPLCTHESCDQVIDMSHIGILQPPAHPYYGWHGVYRSCGGYLGELSKYLECKRHTSPLLGERTQHNLRMKRPLQRLTFNPAYDDFVTQLVSFLNKYQDRYVQP